MCVVILSKNVTTKMAPMSVHVLQDTGCMLTWNALVRYTLHMPRLPWLISTSSLVPRKLFLSYDVASGSKITPCNKNGKPLVVYRFHGNFMASITTFLT